MNENYGDHIEDGLELVKDEKTVSELTDIVTPAVDGDSGYSHPYLECFKFTDEGHNYSHAIINFLGVRYEVFGTKLSDGKWSLRFYYASPETHC